MAQYRQDRRAFPRFEIVGGLWGTLEATVTITLVNISHGGALVECPVRLEPNSVHQLTISHGDFRAAVEVRIRHSQEVHDGPGTPYIIGCEFLSRSTAMQLLTDSYLEAGGV